MNRAFLPMMLSLAIVIFVGCEKKEDKTSSTSKSGTSSAVDNSTEAAHKDICGKCGCCAGCDTCCSTEAEMCSCGYMKGSELCCSGLAKIDGKYCGKCGFEKGGEKCCAEGAKMCTDCNFAVGSPLHEAHAAKKAKKEGNEKDEDEG